MAGLTAEQRASWDERGFFMVRGFADPDTCAAMWQRAVELCRMNSRGDDLGVSLVDPERNPWPGAVEPEDFVSKVFILHTADETFAPFSHDDRLGELLEALLGPDVDCFLSQFIFKNPGAWGQPWHQDSYYFAFEPARPVVGVSLAVTPATRENGCLYVLPGSHRDPIHTHVPDRRPGANIGYVEIVDRDLSAAVAMPMDPGDLLVFDSHLVHRSSDNGTDGLRAAMTYHFAATGTRDLRPGPVNDFVTVR
jgi:phytanoyl-CoA hydroxylase